MAERTLETCQCEASFSVSVDEHGLSFGAPTGADGLLVRLRWQAFEAARRMRAGLAEQSCAERHGDHG